jgi:hypothetical protein
MRTINKGSEPPSLSAWKRSNPHKQYTDLEADIRQDIREHANSIFVLIAASESQILEVAIMSM